MAYEVPANQYHYSNREKRNLRERIRRAIDVICNLAHKIRIRTCQAFKSQNVEKLNGTFGLLGCSNSFVKKWTLYQLHVNTTEQTLDAVWEIYHVFPLSKTNLSNKNEMNKRFNWVNLSSMFCGEKKSQQSKIDRRLSTPRNQRKSKENK